MWFAAVVVFAGVYELLNPISVDGGDVSRASSAWGWGLIAVGVALAVAGMVMDRRNSS